MGTKEFKCGEANDPGGAHTTREWVEIDDLVRVAHLYALTAATFCSPLAA